VAPETLEMTSRLIEKKLKDFGVEVHVVAAAPGPVITRYEIEPATGVKGSQVVNLAKDLARSLSLVSIRVIETIPGKNYMALELPNAGASRSACPRSWARRSTTTPRAC
jgi:S-DNA-T family DNA segregation ATPase FtsK/SpoIIIE